MLVVFDGIKDIFDSKTKLKLMKVKLVKDINVVAERNILTCY